MAEVPEVETLVRDLRAAVVGRLFGGAEVVLPAALRFPDPAAFAALCAGREDQGRGGQLIVHASGRPAAREPDHGNTDRRRDDGARHAGGQLGRGCFAHGDRFHAGVGGFLGRMRDASFAIRHSSFVIRHSSFVKSLYVG